MRFAIPVVLALAGLALAFGVVPMIAPQPAALDEQPAQADKPDLTRDLKLVAEVPGKRTLEAGTNPYLTLTLVNTSKTHSYRIVKPGDGSECGWRDPYVHFTAEQLTVQGMWEPIPHIHPGRCGLFDWNWPKDIMELKPGEKLNLSEHGGPFTTFRLQYPGKIRLFGHYEYRATGGKDGKPRPVAERGAMGDTPLFSLRTEPFEFEVIRPLDLRLKVKQPLKVGVEKKISDVLEATLTNTTGEPISLIANGPTSTRFGFVGGGPEANQPELTEYTEKRGSWVELKPGATATLVGPGELSNGANGTWTGRAPGKYLVRAMYMVKDDGPTVEATIEVPVEK